MGFFSSIKDGISNFYDHAILGKKSISVTNNSQVEAAKLESETKIKLAQMEQEHKSELAGMEKERVEDWRTAQLEIIQAQTMAQMAIDKARAEGMTVLVEYFIDIQEKMVDIAEKRIEIIEKCTLSQIRNIENFYDEIGDKISANRDKYNKEELPELLKILKEFEVGSIEHTLYSEQIRLDMAVQKSFLETQMNRISEQQTLVIITTMETQTETQKQTGKLVQQFINGYLPQGQISLQELPASNTKQLQSPAESLIN